MKHNLGQFLHFSPDNGWFGDAMPVWDGKEYHIYYTKAYKDGGMSWGHISTKDFLSYTEHPDPFDRTRPQTPVSTGCVYVKEGKYYAYFSGLDADKEPGMLCSVSEDGISFPPGEWCFKRPAENYRPDDLTWRDPCVFFDDADRKYHMLFCSKRPERETPDCFAGGTGHAVSDDLVRWTCLPQLPIYGVACSTECPDVFKDRNRYVMIYYWHETRVRSADALEGPWERGDVISPDHFDFMAAKRMTDGDGRHVLVGWLPRRDCDCKERTWGGNMLIPRELRMKGKTPVTRFVPELDKAFIREVPELSPEQLIFCGDGWENKKDSFSAASPAGGTLAYFRDLPAVCRIRTNVTVQDKNGLILFLIGVRPCYHTEKECLDEGYALLLDPSENLVRLRRHYEWDQRNDIAVIPFEFPIGKPFFLDIVLDGGIIEVGVDREQTLVSRMLEFHTGHLAISVQDTKASFEDFSCTTLP